MFDRHPRVIIRAEQVADVIAGVKGDLAHYKAPKRVIFVSQVPRAPNGKADYKAAKQLAYDALGLGE